MNNLWKREYLINEWVESIRIGEVVVATVYLDPIPKNAKPQYRCKYLADICNINGNRELTILDDDLDVLKLKCILKAKELGWNIKYDNLTSK